MPQARRFQFSLKTLMLAVIFGGGLAALFLQRYENAKLKEEVLVLRNEAGHLIVDDPTKMWARSLSAGPLKQIFRIYVPEDMRYRVGAAGGGIPAAGYDKDWTSGLWGQARKGDILVIVADVFMDINQTPVLKVAASGAATTMTLAPPPSGERWPGKSSMRGGIGEVSKSVPFDKPFDLVRVRIEDNATSETRTAGMVIFFVPQASEMQPFGK